MPIWVIFLGVESKTEGVIKESLELKLPPASEGGEGGGGGGVGWGNSSFQQPHLHSKHDSPTEVKHWRKEDVVGAWWRRRATEPGRGNDELTGLRTGGQGGRGAQYVWTKRTERIGLERTL